MKKLSIVIGILFIAANCFAQTTTQDGDWITGATWGGTSPGYTGLNTPTVNHDVESASGLTFANSNGRSLTIGAGGVLVVRGDIVFNVTKNNAAVVVQSGATLIVFGSVELGKNNAGITVEAGGVVVVTDEITAAGNNGTIAGDGLVYTPSTDLNDGGIGEGTVQPIDNLDGDGYEDIEEYVNEGGSEPLPVELLYFESTSSDRVNLEWATATEINNDHFVIERSEDGEYFYEIAKIDGNGNSNEEKTYTFEDKLVVARIEYYRLKQVDYNGDFEYFVTQRVETNIKSSAERYSIYPTLVHNKPINIKSNSPFELKSLTLFNISGGYVQNMITDVEKQNPISYQLNTSQLEKGIYFLRVTSTSGTQTSTRIIIK